MRSKSVHNLVSLQLADPDENMEYRIAPVVILVLGILLQIAILPALHDSQLLYDQGRKFSLLGGILVFFAVAAYFRHQFYSRSFRWSFFILLAAYLVLYISYVYQYINF